MAADKEGSALFTPSAPFCFSFTDTYTISPEKERRVKGGERLKHN